MRWNVSAAAVCLLVLLTGCANPLDKEPSSAAIPAGCGACEEEIAALVETVEAIPGVKAVSSTERTTRGVPVAYLSVGLDLSGKDVASTDIGAVVDAVAEAAWHSEVSPLDVLRLDVELRDGYHESAGFAFGADRATYEEQWGKRPPGSEWSPVPEGDDDLAGCEVDGCPDLMREIARDVAALPGVTTVLEATYVASSPTNSTSVDVTVETDGSDVADAVAEVVWRSQVEPLEWIEVTTSDGGGSPDSTRWWVDPGNGRDRARFEQMWGPRPVEQ